MFLFSFCDVHWLVPYLLPALLLLIPYLIFRNGWKQRIEELTQLRRRNSDRIVDLEGEVNLTKGKLLSTEDKLSMAHTKHNSLVANMPSSTDQRAPSEEIESYRQRITALEGELALKNGDVELSIEEEESYRQRITALEGELALKSGDVSLSEEQEESYRQRITSLEGELALKSGDVSLSKEQEDAYRHRLTSLEGELALKSGDVSLSEEQEETYRRRITELEGELALAKGELQVDQERLSAYQEESTAPKNSGVSAKFEDINKKRTSSNKVSGDSQLSGTKKMKSNSLSGSNSSITESGVGSEVGLTKQQKQKGKKSKSQKSKIEGVKPSVVTTAPKGSGFKAAKEGKFSKIKKNDLTLIEGIGPKAAEILVKNNIKSWATLSTKTPAQLKEILSAAGSRYNHMDPTTWPRQAKLAAGNHWTRLDTLQDKIDSGKIKSDKNSVQGQAKSKKTKKSTKKRGSSKYKNLEKIKEDNLQIIEGIGPKMNQLLSKHKLGTWSALASKSPGEVRLVLDKYGDKYKIIDPKQWPRQASYASKGKWEKLVKHQKADGSASKAEKILIKLGVLSAPNKTDDLKIIEGIGPKISEILGSRGISTWTKLSKTSVKELKAILNSAGNRYGLADPKTWPKQAKLAAAGRFDKLEKLQARI